MAKQKKPAQQPSKPKPVKVPLREHTRPKPSIKGNPRPPTKK